MTENNSTKTIQSTRLSESRYCMSMESVEAKEIDERGFRKPNDIGHFRTDNETDNIHIDICIRTIEL